MAEEHYTCEMIESKDDYDFILKCIIVGDSNVGKTSILHRITNQGFVLNEAPTIGIDFGTIHMRVSNDSNDRVSNDSNVRVSNYSLPSNSLASNDTIDQPGEKKNIELNNPVSENTRIKNNDTFIKVQMWDCAGQVRFRSIVRSYFRQAHVVLFVYDVGDYESFLNLSEWITTVDQHIGRGNYVGCIVANKSDLTCVVDTSLIERFCEVNKDFSYHMLSAKTDTSITILKPICDSVAKAYKKHVRGELTIDKPFWKDLTVELHDNDNTNEKDCFPKCAIS